ncbi:hypothetical protein BDV95DRAFT_636886 [Massariosphaeria phaeospora]|uniref:Uncharacterized protein n=1 Tax=Massariosphaeria phaeospora TaxID=100035 RepID=A0A7C8IDW7_9PLEO|nr:hypothetical protein BDV95DRAFT_636886 [Massariosphaeria phaeospora]
MSAKNRKKRQLRPRPYRELMRVCHQVRKEFLSIYRRGRSSTVQIPRINEYIADCLPGIDGTHCIGSLHIDDVDFRHVFGPINLTPIVKLSLANTNERYRNRFYAVLGTRSKLDALVRWHENDQDHLINPGWKGYVETAVERIEYSVCQLEGPVQRTIDFYRELCYEILRFRLKEGYEGPDVDDKTAMESWCGNKGFDSLLREFAIQLNDGPIRLRDQDRGFWG